MPTYEYACGKCSYEFERFQQINDKPVRHCPRCHDKKRVKRKIGPGGAVIFKGDGWTPRNLGGGK